jgi:hypothetical protein
LKKNHKYVKNSEYKDAPSVVCIEKNWFFLLYISNNINPGLQVRVFLYR